MSSNTKEVTQLLRQAEKAGCTVTRGKKHLRIHTPSGRWVGCPISPSDRRSLLDVRARLRRMGVVL
jgi:hypothetical protein